MDDTDRTLCDSVPMIRNLPFMKAFKNTKTCKKLATRLITEHKQTRIPGQPRDFLDCYLDELDKRGADGSSFCEDRLIVFVLDLHFAGTPTFNLCFYRSGIYSFISFHVFFLWCVVLLISDVSGRSPAKPELLTQFEEHVVSFLLLQAVIHEAVIHEVHRIANTVPHSIYHCSANGTKLMGYFLPRVKLMRFFFFWIILLFQEMPFSK
ncbi:cytochrome P450 2D15-like [Siniperca chuatsi]|uniref:cytochrome P450 2D15-like n=1 Tax=Siniperca chuatsi TaxID=119488 RepID=UPI001CE0C758|nr:cytochrome P450 2D15-like [Siniperca chuatsi]